MTGLVLTVSGQIFEFRTCGTCGVVHAMPKELLDQDRKEGGFRHCPNGHSRGWSKEKSENDLVRQERDRLKQRLAEKDDQIAAERCRTEDVKRQVSAVKGQVTKLKTRAAAGVCPCCHRTVKQMAAHMKIKHPAFKAEVVA